MKCKKWMKKWMKKVLKIVNETWIGNGFVVDEKIG